MTDIDRTADIDVDRGPARVTVRIPLTGHVSELWLAEFGYLASTRAYAEGFALRPGEGEAIEARDLRDDRCWITVRLPADLDRAGVQSVLNVVRELIAQADAKWPEPQTPETESWVREWWASQRG
jgi:hypothetical protein